MIAGIILGLHVIAAIYAFLRYRKDTAAEGLLAVAFVGIIFAVGWTIATALTNLLLKIAFLSQWLETQPTSTFGHILKKELNHDSISLIFLTAGEFVFYYYFLLRGNKKRLILSRSDLTKEESSAVERKGEKAG